MTVVDLITALDLPRTTRVDRRVPKKLLVENGAPTAADKRRINNGVEAVTWVAALKPATIGVPEHRDETREYLEINVLAANLRTGAKAERILALIHRAVPYPVILLADGEATSISFAHKRWSLGEAGETVLDGAVVAVAWGAERDEPHAAAFRAALSAARQPSTSLFAMYQGWVDVALALEAARRTGGFELAGSSEHAVARRAALEECARLEAEVGRLRAVAVREKQIARQVELNLEIKRMEAAQAAARARL